MSRRARYTKKKTLSFTLCCTYFELVFTVAHFSQTYEEYNPPIYAYAGSDFGFIDISPRPSANESLTGGDTLGARCSELSNQPNTFQCLVRSPFPPLIDGDLGPEGTDYTNTMVHAWHRSTGIVTIEYTFGSGLIANPEI